MKKVFSKVKEHPIFSFFLTAFIILLILAATVSIETYNTIGDILIAILASVCWTAFFMIVFPLKQLMQIITDSIYERKQKKSKITDDKKSSIEWSVMLLTAIISTLLLLYPCYIFEVKYGWV